MVKPKRAALYVRVLPDAQTVENQISELREVAERRGWHVVEICKDAGISGAKGRDQRPGLPRDEFERSMIRHRVNAGLSAIKTKIKRDGHFTTKAGHCA